MNFQTVLEELDRLYEEDTKKVNNETEETTQEVVEEGIVGTVAGAAIGKAIGNALTEDEEDATEVEEGLLGGAVAGFAGAALKNKLTEDDEEIDDEIEDDEEAAPEEEQLVLECNKCGGIIIKPFKDVKIDDESDLANVDEACQYCEETEGYKIMGVLAPYGEIVEEATEIDTGTEELEEGIFDKKKDWAVISAPKNDTTFVNGFVVKRDLSKHEAEKYVTRMTKVAPEKLFKAVTIDSKDYKKLESLEEGIFNKNKEPETIRGFSSKDPTFATKIAKELKNKFGGEIKQVKVRTGLADIWVDTAKKAKAANKYITKQYPDTAFSYNEYSRITEDVNTEVLPEDGIA